MFQVNICLKSKEILTNILKKVKFPKYPMRLKVNPVHVIMKISCHWLKVRAWVEAGAKFPIFRQRMVKLRLINAIQGLFVCTVSARTNSFT